jgi:hypothetical protein
MNSIKDTKLMKECFLESQLKNHIDPQFHCPPSSQEEGLMFCAPYNPIYYDLWRKLHFELRWPLRNQFREQLFDQLIEDCRSTDL